jgi:hypothetical protein
MSGAVPKTFWSSPIRYLRWAAHEKPAMFWSVVIGALGPVSLFAIPPMRRMVGDENPPRIPLTYPSTFLLFLNRYIVIPYYLRSADHFTLLLQFQKAPGKYLKGLMIEGGHIGIFVLVRLWNYQKFSTGDVKRA